jgi:phosphomannomutase
MLSVSGARGIVDRSMTAEVAAAFAGAFATHLRSRTGAAPRLCLGRDGRPSGADLAAAAAAGVRAAGGRVLDLGVATTPTVGVMIDAEGADGGLVITASHNPIQWNGLKCLAAGGVAPPREEADAIIRRFQARDHETGLDGPPAETCADPHAVHIERVLAATDPDPIRAAAPRVVLDSVNASGCVPGRRLLEALGCDLVPLNGEPTGHFAHTPEPIEENLRDLARATREAGAVCGFAQDPDADRLAVVDERGVFIGEEYTLVLAAKRVLDARREQGMETAGVALAANLSTSRMIDDLAAAYGCAPVRRTAVGEANVAAAMRADGAVIGGEGNGGVIFPAVTWVRDSLSSMALVLGLLAGEGRPLSAVVADLPRYAMIKQKRDLGAVGGRAAVAPALDRVCEAFAGERVDTVDGVRVDLDEGWVHLRPSNTEPIVRIIAEAPTDAAASALVDRVIAAAGL